jgi:homoserine kinase type II
MISRGPNERPRWDDTLIARVCDVYGLRNVRNVQDLGGSTTLNLRFDTSDGSYVARVYRWWMTEDRLAAVQTARGHLQKHGVPTVVPLPTVDGASWTGWASRLVELEPYVAHEGCMDSWQTLATGLPVLGRTHSILSTLPATVASAQAPISNHLEAEHLVRATRQGAERLMAWGATADERTLLHRALALADRVADAERAYHDLPRQLVHGDFWHNNVLYRAGRIVLVTDLDFLGVRPRVDDLALTLYCTQSTFVEDRSSPHRRAQLGSLVQAYERGLDLRLSDRERAALPLAIIRSALCFIAMIADTESEDEGRNLAAEMVADVAWAAAMFDDLAAWTLTFVHS